MMTAVFASTLRKVRIPSELSLLAKRFIRALIASRAKTVERELLRLGVSEKPIRF